MSTPRESIDLGGTAKHGGSPRRAAVQSPTCAHSECLERRTIVKGISLLMLILIVFAAGCNSSNSATGSGATTPIPGTWSATGTLACTQICPGAQTYSVVLVASPCTVDTPVGTFSVDGAVCFIANNNTASGSISGPGIPTTPKSTGQGILIGVPANPVPDNSTINLLFVSASGGNSFIEFTGSASIAGGKITGTAACSASTPACEGMTASFTANLP